MNTFLMIVLAVDCIILIASILLQSSNSAGLSGAISGGAEQLFGKKKSTPYEELLKKLTVVAAIAFIALSLIIVTLY